MLRLPPIGPESRICFGPCIPGRSRDGLGSDLKIGQPRRQGDADPRTGGPPVWNAGSSPCLTVGDLPLSRNLLSSQTFGACGSGDFEAGGSPSARFTTGAGPPFPGTWCLPFSSIRARPEHSSECDPDAGDAKREVVVTIAGVVDAKQSSNRPFQSQ